VETTIDAPEYINPLKTGFAKENRRKTNYQKRDNIVESAQKKKITTTCWRGGEKPLMSFRLFSCFKARKYSDKSTYLRTTFALAFTLIGPLQQTFIHQMQVPKAPELNIFTFKITPPWALLHIVG